MSISPQNVKQLSLDLASQIIQQTKKSMRQKRQRILPLPSYTQEMDFLQWLGILIIFYVAAILSRYCLHVLWNLIKIKWPKTNLVKKYGDNCWAVITGATDGIGQGFAEQLVEQGFNVCIISRNQQKIDKTIQKLQQLRSQNNPQKKIIGIKFDFTQIQDQKLYNNLINQLKQLDIGIFVNNVGISKIKNHEELTFQENINLINVNCMTMACLNQWLVCKFKERKSKSAIINLSSLTAHAGVPYLSLYSGTKGFDKLLSEGISIEYPNINIQSLEPMMVQSGASKIKKQFNVATSRECARDSLDQLQFHEYATFGYRVHRITAKFVTTFLPKWLLRIASKQKMKALIKELGFDKQE